MAKVRGLGVARIRKPPLTETPANVPDIMAAGAVVRSGKRVLLVHRPRYDDWSFPKGKLDRGEHALAAAVREVKEETGLTVRLGPALPPQRYSVGKRSKTVHYWIGHPTAGDDISGYWPNHEVDDLRWVSVAKAPELLTYPHDRKTLRKSLAKSEPSHALVIVRHALARSRRTWKPADPLRPLLRTGVRQAARLVPMLAAYDVKRVVTSPSERCLRTVAPLADTHGLKIRERGILTEESATVSEVTDLVARLLKHEEGSVLCTHRPVLPWVFEAIGIQPVKLEPAAFVVVHHHGGRVLATEHHTVR
ncbi:MAG: NUDIX hydrolase [Nocardioides sp.]